ENMTSQPGLPENMTSQLGLSDFIVSLETRKEKIISSRNQAEGLQGMGSSNQAEGAANISSTTIDSLFKHLEIQAGKAGVSEFSHDQIKDQFENEFLVSEKFKPNKEGLSSQGQPELGVKQGKVLKEIDSALSGKPGLADDAVPKFKDGEDIAKLAKSNTARGGETALATSDVKTGTIGDALKAKSTFRDLPTHVTNQVSKGIVRAINQGETTLKIQLKPAELGRLQLTINNVGNSMKVSITAENPAAKDILTANVNELKTVLASAGISLDKFDVDMNSEFKQSYANAKNESGNSRQKNRNEKNLFDSIGTEGMDGSIGSLTSENQDGSYHFVA
ncbi:MAG: flagellar hook-length control protein FliK, partial [Desulfobacteraceae bacterium]|nr:flagellar hook-length control protein FliK [Desulfobacteraceae bacterium]